MADRSVRIALSKKLPKFSIVQQNQWSKIGVSNEDKNKNESLITVNTKKRVLSDEFGIHMTETIESTVDNMCNLSYGIAEKSEMKTKVSIAVNMIRRGYPDLEVAVITGLPEQTAAELRNKECETA